MPTTQPRHRPEYMHYRITELEQPTRRAKSAGRKEAGSKSITSFVARFLTSTPEQIETISSKERHTTYRVEWKEYDNPRLKRGEHACHAIVEAMPPYRDAPAKM